MTKANCQLLKEPTTDCHSQQIGHSVIRVLCVCIGVLLGLCWCSSSVEGKDSCDLMTNDTACIGPILYWKTGGNYCIPSQSGVEFLLRGDSVPTDGSGHLLITDISLHNGLTSISDEDALFCYATKDVTILRGIDIGDWYLEPDFEATTAYGKRIQIDGDNDRGWTRSKGNGYVSGTYRRPKTEPNVRDRCGGEMHMSYSRR